MPHISVPDSIKTKPKITNGYEFKSGKWVSKKIDWNKISEKKVAPPFSVCRKPPVNGPLTYCHLGGDDYDVGN
ncbi:hypothetical protein DdX_16152 [Ditylenchus destructor]|uniref:AGC-kinase C-terminal domain-containing protein n=1 Tax=Ditylenchus destructor TaxID=166010 RepID=A0AAD4MPH0_9BILA|nr:hypothetical protein DdX_16152 [Ditylenchus destructor]